MVTFLSVAGTIRVFLRTLKQVRTVYQDAKLSADEKGLMLHNSRPPVLRRDALR